MLAVMGSESARTQSNAVPFCDRVRRRKCMCSIRVLCFTRVHTSSTGAREHERVCSSSPSILSHSSNSRRTGPELLVGMQDVANQVPRCRVAHLRPEYCSVPINRRHATTIIRVSMLCGAKGVCGLIKMRRGLFGVKRFRGKDSSQGSRHIRKLSGDQKNAQKRVRKKSLQSVRRLTFLTDTS